MHRAVSIRPQDPHARLLQSFEKFWAGMPVGVILTCGDDSHLGPHGRQKFGRCRILASVMTDLQHFGAHRFRTVPREDFTLGLFFGLIAGYFRGFADELIMRILDALLAFPALLLAILVVATFGRGLGTVVIALGVIYVPAMARLVRSVTLVQRSLAYVDAGRALGFSDGRILFRHILPNLVAAVVVQSTIDLAYAILDIAALSFLGLGQQPPDPDWGSMLSDGRAYLLQNAWPAMSAGLAIMFTVVSFNLVGDGLRSQFDPRERER